MTSLAGNVAVSGDTLVVGAYGEDSNGTGVGGEQGNNLASDAGAAYIFAPIYIWLPVVISKGLKAGHNSNDFD